MIKIFYNSGIFVKKHKEDFAYDLKVHKIEIRNLYGKQQIVYHLGVKTQIPNKYAALVIPRSSVSKTRLRLTNSIGLIDPNYRGEWLAIFDVIKPLNQEEVDSLLTGNEVDGVYSYNDRIVQMFLIKRRKIKFIHKTILSQTDRGKGGFGSTGKK